MDSTTDDGAAAPDLSQYPEGGALQSAAASHVEKSLVYAAAQANAMVPILGGDSSGFMGEQSDSGEQPGAEQWSLLGAVTTATADAFSDAVTLGATEAAGMAAGSVCAVASSLQPLVDSAPAPSVPRLAALEQTAELHINTETSPRKQAMLTAPKDSDGLESAAEGSGDGLSSSAEEDDDENSTEEGEEEDYPIDEDSQKQWLDAQEEADVFTYAKQVPAGHRYRVRLDKAPNGSFGLTVKFYRHWGVVVHALPRTIATDEPGQSPPVSPREAGQDFNSAARAGVAPGDVLVAVGNQSAFPDIGAHGGDDNKDAKKGSELAGAMRSLGELLRAAPDRGAVLTFDRPKQRQLLAASPSEPPRTLGFEEKNASSSTGQSHPSLSNLASSKRTAPLVRRLAVAWRPVLRAGGANGSGYYSGQPAKSRALAALLQAHGAVSAAEALILSAQLACLEQRTSEWASRGVLTLPESETSIEAVISSGNSGSSVGTGGQAPPESTSLVSRLLSPTRVITGGFFSSSSSTASTTPLAIGGSTTTSVGGEPTAGQPPSFVSLPLAADKLEQPLEAWRLRRIARKRGLLRRSRRNTNGSRSAAAVQRLPLHGVRRALSVRIVGTLSQPPGASSPLSSSSQGPESNNSSAFRTAYIVFVADAESGTQWTVNRRFSEFRTLEQSLADCWPELRKM